MPRKSRKKSKSSAETGGKEETVNKMCQGGGDEVPSTSSSVQKPGTKQTKKAKSVNQTVTNSKTSTDNKLLALLKKPEIQGILEGFRESAVQSSTSPLSNFKIPKKKSDNITRNDDTGRKTTETGKARSPEKNVKLSLSKRIVQDETKSLKRKSEDLGNAEQTIQSAKRLFSGVGVPKGSTEVNIAETAKDHAANSDICASRPTLKARRTQRSSISNDPSPASLPISATATNVDTPQMKQLKALLDSRKNKKKQVKKGKTLQSAPLPEHSSPMKSTPTINSGNKSCPPQSAGKVKARSAETQATRTHNPISEIIQIVKNEEADAYVQFDTTDAMDVDIIQTVNTSVKNLVVIVDTNVWIGYQHLIEEVLDTEFQVLTSTEQIKATVIIPWMVLQEIDHNIHKKVPRFQGAAKFVHNLLSNNHPQVKGEKASDAIIGNDFSELIADDSILNCAIKYSKLTYVKTVFLTNDINLLNKALVHGLAAFKPNKELINNLRRCLCDNNDNYSQIICNPEDPLNTSANQLQASSPSNSFMASPLNRVNNSFTQVCSPLEDIEMDIDDPMGMDESEFLTSEIDISKNEEISTHSAPNQAISSPPSDVPTFEAVATAVQQSLTSIIVPKMVEEYGQDDWKFAIKIKPPFTVESALKCIQAHWIAVFSYMFSSRSKDVVDELVNKFHQKPTSLNSSDFKIWRLTVSQMALALLSHNEGISNRPRVVDCCRLLQAYIQVESNNST